MSECPPYVPPTASGDDAAPASHEPPPASVSVGETSNEAHAAVTDAPAPPPAALVRAGDPNQPPACVTRTADGQIELVVLRDSPPILRAVVVATGETFEATVTDKAAQAACPAARDTASLLRLVERAAAVARHAAQHDDGASDDSPDPDADADADHPTPATDDARVRATYVRSRDSVRFDFVVLAADPVLDAPYAGSIEMHARAISPEDAFRVLRRDLLAHQDILVHDARTPPALRRVHPSELWCAASERPWWTLVACAPLRAVDSLEVTIAGPVGCLLDLRHLPFLRELRLGGSGGELRDISALSALAHLEVLRMHSALVTDVRPLARLRHLRDLLMRACPELVDASPLGACAQLTNLDLTDCAALERLPAAPRLRRVCARGCVALSDLVPLTSTLVYLGSVVARAAREPRADRPADEPTRSWSVDDEGVHGMLGPRGFGRQLMGLSDAYPPSPDVVDQLIEHSSVKLCNVSRAADGGVALQLVINAEGWVSPEHPEWLQDVTTDSDGDRADPVITGRLANIAVDLRDTRVTRMNLAVLARWYASQSVHGAVVRLPDVRPDGSADSATKLFIPPANLGDYMVPE